MVANANMECNNTQSVPVLVVSEEKRNRHYGTTFKILPRLGNSETHWVYSLESYPEQSNFPIYQAFNKDASTKFVSSGLGVIEQFTSSILIKHPIKLQEYNQRIEDQAFFLDKNKVEVIELSNFLFSYSKPLKGLEAKVLRDTIRRNARSSSTLPNRM